MSGTRWTEPRAAEWLHWPPEHEIRSGAVYYPKCLGTIEGARWLDGNTIDRSVGLATLTTYPHTGTRWRAQKLPGGAWAFRCLGTVAGPRWLDGRTVDGTVGLAPSPEPPFSGARWRLVPIREGVFALECLGEIAGSRFLDGVTARGTTRLVPHAGPPLTGTYWELRRERWWVGCNFIPSTAVNQLEMWQRETFDPATITRELGWAAELGFNAVRVFLHDLLWQDTDGLKARMRIYLDRAAAHGIRTLFVFFDDCWNAPPLEPGPQPDPTRNKHNSRWLQSPGDAIVAVADRSTWSRLEAYVKGIIEEFADNEWVIGWDLYNEPGGGMGPEDRPCPRKLRSLPLVERVFAWARDVDPTQPLTAGVFSPACEELRAFQLDASDVISFHSYFPPGHGESVLAYIDELEQRRRPLLCTEYMARPTNSRFENHLHVFADRGVGCFNWGLVAGRTQTFVPWELPRAEWHHDILHTWGTPYCEAEVAVIAALTGKGASGAGLQSNAVYRFKCLGHVGEQRWLDGRTAVGEVGLVTKQTVNQHSGTRWRAVEIMDGVFTFRCLGDIEGYRWLDGRTHDGSVGLARDASHEYSGTRWQVCRIRTDVYVFRCLGDVEGHRLLDGRTGDGTVGLSTHAEPRFTGLQWEAKMISAS